MASYAAQASKLVQVTSPPVALSLILFVYERALVPIYASGPTNYMLDWVVLGGILIAVVQPFRLSLAVNALVAAVLLTAAPNATYWAAVLTSRRKDPVWGPTYTHLSVLFPLVVALVSFFRTGHSSLRPPQEYRPMYAALSYLATSYFAKTVWPQVSSLNEISDSTVYLSLAGIFYATWISSLQVQPKKSTKKGEPTKSTWWTREARVAVVGLFFAVWWALHPKLASPVLPHPLKEPYDHAAFPLRVLSSVQSITGLISVAEIPPPPGEEDSEEIMHSVRYLRASHSILGGVWTDQKVMVIDDQKPVFDSEGKPLGDSIYAAFVLQEAVRFVQSPSSGKSRKFTNGLIIGLGTGISATAFQRHGISTTIVEIDPAVYDAARNYFGLPDPGPGKVFLEDARGWVERQRASIESGETQTRFDFVVHDCFSGGGVPQHIFTSEFWEDVKKILTPDGIVVVNFAGIVKSEASRLVVFTLLKSFGHCRAFHDLLDKMSPEQYESDFINIAVFCAQTPLSFRTARTSDFLGSPLRRHVLESLSRRELDLEVIRSSADKAEEQYILTDARNPLGKLQEEQGHHHWSVMRDVLADKYWEIY
ncbi:spermidine synthase [Pluteus cervinus]|uniref:Spermidine synthase n=1 Tax=Pluteus cervinus TaxID=181527 RepID=A0ACD3B157_9AGAR|nr:spermidine synthase [Pluteus cervinus]